MYYYFAQFMRDEERPECVNVIFPDMPGCATFGEGIQDAMRMAMDALTGYLEVEMEDGNAIPEPSDIELARQKSEAYNRELGIATRADALYMLVPADPKPEPFVRLNISLRPSLVARIDRHARELGLTRSGYLARAAARCLDEMRNV